MPMPTDEALVAKADEVKNQLKGAFGTPPGYRPAHAKGTLLTGTFHPANPATSLSKAHHLHHPCPILARFSSSTGLPQIPDTDPNSSPKGLALRFQLPPSPSGKRRHTDIITHSVPLFPTRTGAEFSDFLKALGTSTTKNGEGDGTPTALDTFLKTHPHTLAFLNAPKPLPTSFATENYYGLTAYKFIAADDTSTFIRYEFVPIAGISHLTPSEASSKSPTYLTTEIKERTSRGAVGMKLVAQIAQEGDVTDDVTVQWPGSREKVELGTVWLDSVVGEEEGLEMQKGVIFDPVPRVDGIEGSGDPLLEFRAALYLDSGRERRGA